MIEVEERVIRDVDTGGCRKGKQGQAGRSEREGGLAYIPDRGSFEQSEWQVKTKKKQRERIRAPAGKIVFEISEG